MSMTPKFPKNGLLSGMIITGIAALVGIGLGLFSPAFVSLMNHPLTPNLQFYFLITILLMTLHKVESYFFKEFDHCPVYLTQGSGMMGENVRRGFFLSFVPIFIGMLFFSYLAFVGGSWHMILLMIWIAQGLHEMHHAAKSLVRQKIYPGLFSSIAFVSVISFKLFPLWYDNIFTERGGLFNGYYALLPIVFLMYYFEDKTWYKKAGNLLN